MVVGAGLAGVELASTLAERLPVGAVQIIDTGTSLAGSLVVDSMLDSC